MVNPIYNYDLEFNQFEDIALINNDNWKTYNFLGHPVPRVSEILSVTGDNSYLIDWSSRFGKKSIEIRDNALAVGSATHERIENYLLYGKGIRSGKPFENFHMAEQCENAFNSFLSWYNTITNVGFKMNVYAIEKSFSCPWYGGTTDCILGLRRKNKEQIYIVDFKTSKSISITYWLQVYAYYYALMYNKYVFNDNTIPNIDGLAILRVCKDSKYKYEWKYLNFHNQDDAKILDIISRSFYNMIEWYYSWIQMKGI